MEEQGISLDYLRSRVQFITPEIAQRMLTTLAYSRQRHIRLTHVEYLRSCMRDGEMKFEIIQEAEFPDGHKVLIDGYHRLTAQVAEQKTLPAVVVTHKINSERELGELYATIDRSLVRKPGDMARAMGVEEKTRMNTRQLTIISSAVTLISADFNPWTSPTDRSLIKRTKAAEKWLQEGEAYMDLLEGSTFEVRSKLYRAPVVAVALITLRHHPGPAETFWGTLAKEDGLKRYSPQATLLAWLRMNTVARIGQYVYARYVASAWNAFYENRELQRFSVKDPRGPVVIQGTPYK